MPPPQPWQALSVTAPQSIPRLDSAPFAHARNASVGPVDGNGDPFPVMDPATTTGEELEHDFDGECYYARHPDEINPEFSLGIIEWQAALPTKIALPCTFAEAELEALAPRNPRPDDEDSISDYFTKAKRDEAFLSIRQTEAWEEVKDDLIYREFPCVCSGILPMSEMLERYRNRPDPSWSNGATDLSTSGSPVRSEPYIDPMGVDSNADGGPLNSEPTDEQGDVLDNPEQALCSNSVPEGQKSRQQSTVAEDPPRAASSLSARNRLSRPTVLDPVRDQAQEDILLALGVTGEPKTVFVTPGPAFGPPLSQQAAGAAPIGRQGSVTSNPSMYCPPPPPPISVDQRHNKGHGMERPSTANSQHITAGSDFDADATPRPKTDRIHSRKRSHGELKDGLQEGHGEVTPTPRHKQPRFGGAYE